MPVEAKTDIKGSRKRAYVTVRYRLRGKRAVYQFLNELAGANRYLWNSTLGNTSKDYEETGKTKTSYHDLCKWYKYHKHTEAQWLSKYPVALTRTGLKNLSNAFKQFFNGTQNYPNFESKKKAKKSFAFDVSDASLFKENGYVRLKRGLYAKLMQYHRINEYSNPIPKSARIFEEHGNRYITVQYEVDAIERETDERGIGVDRNVGQVADNNGTINRLTKVEKHNARIKFLKRRLARQTKGSNRWKKTKKTIARHERDIAHIQKNDLRHIAR
ncbi:MAG: transposase [Bacteroidetes bacterium]|nr:transposase [Bacteroidota bacterium]